MKPRATYASYKASKPRFPVAQSLDFPWHSWLKLPSRSALSTRIETKIMMSRSLASRRSCRIANSGRYCTGSADQLRCRGQAKIKARQAAIKEGFSSSQEKEEAQSAEFRSKLLRDHPKLASDPNSRLKENVPVRTSTLR